MQEMNTQMTNSTQIINEVLLTQQSIKDLLTSLLHPRHEPSPPSLGGTLNSVPSQSQLPGGVDRMAFPTHNGIAVAGCVLPPSPRDHQSNLPSPPSWMTADTVPVSTRNHESMEPETEYTNALGGVSQTEIAKEGDHPSVRDTDPMTPCTESAQTACLNSSPVVDSRVSTRSRGATTDPILADGVTEGAERTKCALKEKADAIACMRPCWILHPNAGDNIVAEGRAGGSWKSPTQKFGYLCGFGDQMVQVHRVFYGNHRLLYTEERNPNLTTLKDAVVKPKYSNVYIKWDSRFLIAKPTKKSTGN